MVKDFDIPTKIEGTVFGTAHKSSTWTLEIITLMSVSIMGAEKVQ